MRKLYFLTIAALLFFSISSSSQLHATHGFYSLDIEGNLFVIGTPNNWGMVRVEKPFDYKFVHKEKKRECFLMLSCFNGNGKLEELDLFGEMVEATVALYGEEFWEKQNYLQGAYSGSDKDSDMCIWSFCWAKENEVENVIVIAHPERSENRCSRCILFVEKMDKAVFEKDPSGTHASLEEDFTDFLDNIEFFKKNR